MTRTPCPTDTQLARYVDRDLSQEDDEAVVAHLRECSHCRAQDEALRVMVKDIRTVALPDFEPTVHVNEVMARLQDPPRSTLKSWPRTRALPALVGSLAAGFLLYIGSFALRDATVGTWQARGGGSAVAAIARDIGVQTYASEGGLRPLTPGSVIRAKTPLTAGFRNLGESPVYLLLFAVDERNTVHWISPMYERAGQDPKATLLPASRRERLLPSTVVFDGLVNGPLRIVTVITEKPVRVSAIESIRNELSSLAITRRLPQAEVRELRIEVRETEGIVP